MNDSRKYNFINGSKLEVGTIYCVGKNYPEHIKEMGDGEPTKPVIFIKPPSAYIPNGSSIILPSISNNVHHEVELVIIIGKDVAYISKEDYQSYIAGIAVGIDVTMRDIQLQAKSNGEPWAISKGFRTSAPISDILPIELLGNIEQEFTLELYVNDELKQRASTLEMQWKIPELIEYISSIFDLRSGDAIFTGTPSGVGKINRGDKIQAKIIGLIELNVNVI